MGTTPQNPNPARNVTGESPLKEASAFTRRYVPTQRLTQ